MRGSLTSAGLSPFLGDSQHTRWVRTGAPLGPSCWPPAAARLSLSGDFQEQFYKSLACLIFLFITVLLSFSPLCHQYNLVKVGLVFFIFLLTFNFLLWGLLVRSEVEYGEAQGPHPSSGCLGDGQDVNPDSQLLGSDILTEGGPLRPTTAAHEHAWVPGPMATFPEWHIMVLCRWFVRVRIPSLAHVSSASRVSHNL